MYNIAIFGYNFHHKKSEDFLHILKKYNINIVAYIAADSVKLNLPKKVYKKNIPQYCIYHPKELCEIYDIPFFESIHNSEDTIKILEKTNANLGIVSGARILRPDIINSLKYGVVNFHPGKIPDASGLDGLFWSIYKGIKPFVTTHFIDEKVDAGRLISFREVEINKDDRIEDIKLKISISEYKELEDLCKKYLSNQLEITSTMFDNYIEANKPMEPSLQLEVLSKFNLWKEKTI